MTNISQAVLKQTLVDLYSTQLRSTKSVFRSHALSAMSNNETVVSWLESVRIQLLNHANAGKLSGLATITDFKTRPLMRDMSKIMSAIEATLLDEGVLVTWSVDLEEYECPSTGQLYAHGKLIFNCEW